MQVDHTKLRERIEQEAERNRRHHGGFGLLRIGRGEQSAVLDETMHLETRRTDTISPLPDGSWVLLALEVDEHGMRSIKARLVAGVNFRTGVAPLAQAEIAIASRVAGSSRKSADAIWNELSAAWNQVRHPEEKPA